MSRPVDEALLQRAQDLAQRGLPMEEVARRVGVSRVTLYRYGIRSGR